MKNGSTVWIGVLLLFPQDIHGPEDRELLARLATSGEDDQSADNEAAIEKYLRSVLAVENILTLDRLRQVRIYRFRCLWFYKRQKAKMSYSSFRITLFCEISLKTWSLFFHFYSDALLNVPSCSRKWTETLLKSNLEKPANFLAARQSILSVLLIQFL